MAINNSMSIKISELPSVTLPYTGNELIPFVDYNVGGGVTSKGSLSTLTDYLSVQLVANSSAWDNTYTSYSVSSANWQNTYTSYSTSSANFAVKDSDNNFLVSQIIQGSVSVDSVNLSDSSLSLCRPSNDENSIGLTNVSLTGDNTNVFIVGFKKLDVSE